MISNPVYTSPICFLCPVYFSSDRLQYFGLRVLSALLSRCDTFGSSYHSSPPPPNPFAHHIAQFVCPFVYFVRHQPSAALMPRPLFVREMVATQRQSTCQICLSPCMPRFLCLSRCLLFFLLPCVYWLFLLFNACALLALVLNCTLYLLLHSPTTLFIYASSSNPTHSICPQSCLPVICTVNLE